MVIYLPGQRITAVTGVNASVTFIDTAVYVFTYALVSEFKADWGFNVSENLVGGTNIPVGLTEEFKGEITMKNIYSTENQGQEQLAALMTLTNGAIGIAQATWTAKDTQGAPVTRIFACATIIPDKYTYTQNGTKAIFHEVHAKMFAIPVIT